MVEEILGAIAQVPFPFDHSIEWHIDRIDAIAPPAVGQKQLGVIESWRKHDHCGSRMMNEKRIEDEKPTATKRRTVRIPHCPEQIVAISRDQTIKRIEIIITSWNRRKAWKYCSRREAAVQGRVYLVFLSSARKVTREESERKWSRWWREGYWRSDGMNIDVNERVGDTIDTSSSWSAAYWTSRASRNMSLSLEQLRWLVVLIDH